MWFRIALAFILGLAVGAIGVGVIRNQSEPAPPAPVPEISAPPGSAYDEPDGPGLESLENNPGLGDRESLKLLDIQESLLPDMYVDMIGPNYRQGPTTAESYVEFLAETRDEPWAAAMEAGIQEYFSRIGPENGMVLEHAECRSRHCVVAGYIVDGFPENHYLMIVNLRQEHWWDGGRQGGGTSRQVENRAHYVYMLVRFDSE